MKRWIKKWIPDQLKVWLKNRIGNYQKSWWNGDYKSWKDAARACGGYNENLILEKVKAAVMTVKRGEAAYERDSVVFKEPFVYMPVAEALKSCVLNNALHICDFGGSLGSSYFQYRHLFSNQIQLRWAVVEQKHFVETGKLEIAEKELNFYSSVEEVLQVQNNQVVLLFSVLQYLPDPYDFIQKLLTYQFRYILIDRTGFIQSGKDRLTIQTVPETIYRSSYPAWFFSEDKFKAAFSQNYEFVSEYLNDIPLPQNLGKEKVYWKGFFLKHKNG